MISVKRTRLLAAGEALARTLPLGQFSAEAVAAEARLERAHFDAEFATLEDYFAELQRDFLEGIVNALIEELGATPPSLARMKRAMDVQLDLCLQRRALRRLLVEARRLIPTVADLFHKQGQVTALMMGVELKALGCPNPAQMGRLYWVLMLEAAQLEAESGGPLPAVRQTVQEFLVISTTPRDS